MTAAPKWTVSRPDSKLTDKIAKKWCLSPATAACLINRNIIEDADVKAYLEPKLSALTIPDKMADLSLATARVADGIVGKERIAVFGDYDVDGVSSAALVTTFLEMMGAKPHTFLADRFSGYGMGDKTVDEAHHLGCKLLIVVDCGTSEHVAAKRARELGIDMVVIDHHRVEGDHPDVHAFVNPMRTDCGFKDKTLAAVGLAFYFAGALRGVLVERGVIEREDIDLRKLLGLVALGTVADVMPLKGNNRILAWHGLRQISNLPSNGIKALLRVAHIRASRIRADHIAFQMAPRLNAAGRIASARSAYDLLVASDVETAQRIAGELDKLSQDRRVLESEVLKSAKIQIEKRCLFDRKILLIGGDGWHRGVIGIVASRLAEWVKKPVYVVGFDGDMGTGSARGGGQMNLYEGLLHASPFLERFGGHRDAAGFTVHKSKFEGLEAALQEYAAQNSVEKPEGRIVCDRRLFASELTSLLTEEIAKLGPFGSGNAEPVFEIDGLYVLEKRVVGQDHLKLRLKTPSGSIGAFGPRMGSIIDDVPALVRVAATITVDEWRGDGSPELRLVAHPVPGE